MCCSFWRQNLPLRRLRQLPLPRSTVALSTPPHVSTQLIHPSQYQKKCKLASTSLSIELASFCHTPRVRECYAAAPLFPKKRSPSLKRGSIEKFNSIQLTVSYLRARLSARRQESCSMYISYLLNQTKLSISGMFGMYLETLWEH